MTRVERIITEMRIFPMNVIFFFDGSGMILISLKKINNHNKRGQFRNHDVTTKIPMDTTDISMDFQMLQNLLNCYLQLSNLINQQSRPLLSQF